MSSLFSSQNDNILNSLLKIFQLIEDGSTFPAGIEILQNLIINSISNPKSMNFIFQQIQNQLLNLQNELKEPILLLIPYICNSNPTKIYSYIDKIISIYQNSISESTVIIFKSISKSFGDTSKILIEIPSFNLSNSSSTLKEEFILSKDGIIIYNKLKDFCFTNIKSLDCYCQTCGILCLTSFIESCTYNYTNKENLKSIWEILIYQIGNSNFLSKLELLNCIISLIFSSESKFCPYASMTLYKILDFITDKDWLKRKLALNIVYTLIYYCNEEIAPLKGYISTFISELKNDNVDEVREVCVQILKMLNEFDGSSSERSSFSLSSNRGSQKKININKFDRYNYKPKTTNDNNTNNNISNNKKSKYNKSCNSEQKNKSQTIKTNKKKIEFNLFHNKNKLNLKNIHSNNNSCNYTIDSIREQFELRVKTPTSNSKRGVPTERSASAIYKNRTKARGVIFSPENKNLSYSRLRVLKGKNSLFNGNKIKNTRTNSTGNITNTNKKQRINSKSQKFFENTIKSKQCASASKINNILKGELLCEKVKEEETEESKNVTTVKNQDEINNYIDNAIMNKTQELIQKISRLENKICLLEKKVKEKEKKNILKREFMLNLNEKNFEGALNNAIEMNSITKIIYVFKHILLCDDSVNLPNDMLEKVCRKIKDNLIECNDYSILCSFIKKKIIDKKIKFQPSLNKEISSSIMKILNKKEALGLKRNDTESLHYIVKNIDN